MEDHQKKKYQCPACRSKMTYTDMFSRGAAMNIKPTRNGMVFMCCGNDSENYPGGMIVLSDDDDETGDELECDEEMEPQVNLEPIMLSAYERSVARSLHEYDYATTDQRAAHFHLSLINTMLCADRSNLLLLGGTFPVYHCLFNEWNEDRRAFYERYNLL